MANTEKTNQVDPDDISPDDKVVVEGEEQTETTPPLEAQAQEEVQATALEKEQVEEKIEKVEKKIKEKKEQLKKELKREREEDEDDDEDADDDEDEDDEETKQAERERERKRAERQERKRRREKAIERDKLELNFLRERNEQLERRMMAQELRANRQDHYSLEQKIAEAEQRARDAEEVMAQAIASANGDDAAKALRIRDEARDQLKELAGFRETIAKEQEKKEQEIKKVDERPKPDPMIALHAQKFVDKHKTWYSPNSTDLDSRLVLTIDQGLVDEGFNPKTEHYWEELDRRVRRYLPHRFEHEQTRDDDDRDPPVRPKAKPEKSSNRVAQASEPDDDRETEPQVAPTKKGPVITQAREHAPASTRREIYVSRERKEALISAGVWDDPVLRARYLKQYQKWDKENSSR